MSEGCKATFIIPARNSEATLKACLSSIFGQTANKGDYEVLLIDNGSADMTVSVAREMGATVLEGPGLTVAALRNLGARKAHSEILAFVDSDCMIAPCWLQNALALFDNPQIGAAGAPTTIPENSTWVQRAWYMHRKKTIDREFVVWLPTENLLVRRDIFNAVGGFNEELVTCEDVDLCYKIGKFYKILSDSSILSVHLGEARTLRQFFKKEKWRGKGNFRGGLAHGIKVDEIPSLLTPFYGLTVLTFFIFVAIRIFSGADISTIIIFGALIFPPPVIMAIRTSLRGRSLKCLLPLVVLYTVYVAARTVSAFSKS